MKDTIKLIATVIGGAVGAAIPIICAYKFWAWAMTLVPIASEWAGLIKLAITIGLILIGGGLTFICALALGMLFALAVLSITE